MASEGTTKDAKNGAPEVPSGMEEEAKLFEEFLEIPVITKVTLRNDQSINEAVNISVYYSQRNTSANARRKFMTSLTLMDQKDLNSFGPVAYPVELADTLMNSTSPSGRRMVVAKKGGEGDGCCLEIWDGKRVVKSIFVPKTTHGSIVNDGLFSRGASWNGDETKIVYAAESPAVDRTPEWGAPANKEGPGPKGWRGKGSFQEDWGEQRDDMRPPTLFTMDIETGSIEALEGLPENCSCGQAVWTRDGTGVVFVGWNHTATNFNNVALRLGFVYCLNRPCSLYYKKLSGEDSKSVCLTPSLLTAMGPRFSPNGSTLVFFSCDNAAKSGVHCASSTLHKLDWTQEVARLNDPSISGVGDSMKTVVGTVRVPESADHFPGFYGFDCDPFPLEPFVGESTVVCSTEWGPRITTVSIDIETGVVQRIVPEPNGDHSFTLAAMNKTVALAVQSGFKCPGRLMISRVGEWNWTAVSEDVQVSLPTKVTDVLKGLEMELFTIKPTVGPEFPVQGFMFRKKGVSGPQPTILSGHGGPHSSTVMGYYMNIPCILELGYTLVLVNYRGSLGYGEDFVQALPGNVGTYDVADCIAALDHSVEKGWTDNSRVGVMGGSHGGFLTGHLVGQHPERFLAGVLLNPVMNLAHMVSTSDISDWIYVEALGAAGRDRFTAIPTPEDYEVFLSKSPARYVNQVKAPLLFLLGKKDRRVPVSDGLRYLAALRSREDAPESSVWMFPEDNHPLDKPQTDFERTLCSMWWFKKFGVLGNSK
ncbi:hypothetical protein BSKO_06526 [Bryopsis sp. KO-2023]|nr:hypothetical protein BSKO_06526 [Bryopsis sp. KO-2023]